MRARYVSIGLGIILFGAAAGAQDTATSRAGTRNAIVGRVVDRTGQPVSGVFVTLLQNNPERKGFARVGIVRMGLGVRTDASGIYRLENLTLGPYFVVALPENAAAGADGRMNRAGHGITYYPAASTRADAREVMVSMVGPVVANITLAPAALAVISGTVFKQDGKPADGGTLVVAHGDGMFGVHGRSMRIRPDGSFLLPALPPGIYILEFREGPWPPPRGEPALVSGATVTVDGRDLAGIRVGPTHPVRATGRIVLDSTALKLLQPSSLHVRAYPRADCCPGPTRPGTVADDFRFEFEAWPGLHDVGVVFDSPGWAVKSIRYKGADVTKSGIEFKEGQDISGIEIELTKLDGRGQI